MEDEIMAQRHRKIIEGDIRDGFLRTCRDTLLAAELSRKYASQLDQQRLPSYKIQMECDEDKDTLSLLESKALPMPINKSGYLPYEVWYFKVWYQANPAMNVEMYIGKFNTAPTAALLGMHDGQKWTSYPLTTPESMKLDNTEPKS